MLLHVIAVSIGVVAQSLKPVRLLSRFARTVAEQCLIRLHSSSNVFGATHVYHSNLKWTRHVDYIIKKANKGLYSLRVLKQCEAPPVSLAKVFVIIVRPILEYRAVAVWQNIAEFLSSTIDSIQKRAMHLIFPTHDYNEALYALSLTTLKERRVHLGQV